jgi:aspartyl-tRNA(Asn)/glutamyl-tRNA(Gln) amidotransferase subunit C
MKISKDEVVYAADIARIYLTEKEIIELSEELSTILTYIQKLEELDTDNVAPIAHLAPVTNILREDCVLESLDIEDVFNNAPDKEKGFFKVPRIIED